MSNRSPLGPGLEVLVEGWYALRQRAGHAITHFMPRDDQGRSDPAVVGGGARWGVLAAEVGEEEARVIVRLEIPGMAPEDFEIEVVEDVLAVRGEKRPPVAAAADARWFLLERAYGAFERTVHLPVEVDPERTTADYRGGVLTVILPKRMRPQSRRVRITST